MKLKIVTFNVQHFLNYITQQIDMDMFERVIRSFDADVIGLNEVYGAGYWGDQVTEMGRRLGYHAYFAQAINVGEEGLYGNGLLSRHPMVNARTILVPNPDQNGYDGFYETRCLLQADIDVPGGLQVNVIHMGLNPDEQENAVITVAEHVSARRSILMGDFNMTPDDVNLVPIQAFMQDAAALFDEAEKPSFPSDAPDIKIDYIFTSEDIKCLSADIPEIIASDHRPHIATVER